VHHRIAVISQLLLCCRQGQGGDAIMVTDWVMRRSSFLARAGLLVDITRAAGPKPVPLGQQLQVLRQSIVETTSNVSEFPFEIGDVGFGLRPVAALIFANTLCIVPCWP
jgi:hypothetical protein